MAVIQWDDLYSSYSKSLFHTIILLVGAAGLLFILLYYGLKAPRFYVWMPEGLFLKFLLGSKFYAYRDYDIVRDVSPSEIKGSVRVFGSGGYCGYIGLFRTPQKGVCQFYLTNQDGYLIKLIDRTRKRDIYISQD